MQHYDHIIIGGGICGATAAETIRARAPEATVLLVGAETHPTYSRVLLPHVVRGKTDEANVYLKPDAWAVERRIDARRGVRVTAVDTAARAVTLSDGSAATYGALLIATGGALRPSLFDALPPGAPVHRLQTVEDARALRAAPHGGTAVVVGGGFIALELIMSYAQQGAHVVALLRRDGFFASSLDEASRRALNAVLERNGVEVRTGITVTDARADGSTVVVTTSDGATIAANAVGVGIGVVPDAAFLAGSGIATRTGVLTDEHLRTSAPGVYAAGDAAEFLDPLTGTHRLAGNWQNALFQGKLAGENMTGGDAAFSAITAYAITVFGVPLAFVGATDIAPDRRVVQQTGPEQVTQLLIKDGRVIGATCIGPFTDRARVHQLITSREEFVG